MGRYTGPKERLSRREGVELHLKGSRSFGEKTGLKRKPFVPGQHGSKRKARLSNYGLQLREKQKVKRTYGIRENQFRNIYLESNRRSKVYNSDKGLELLRMLELRVDNVLYLADWLLLELLQDSMLYMVMYFLMERNLRYHLLK
jgi:small subunit ribosomal protein S4